VTPRNFWADSPPKSGVAPTRFSLFFPVTFPFVMSLIPFVFRQLPASWGEEIGEAKSAASNSYLLHWFRLDSRCSARHNTPPFAASFHLLGGGDVTVSLATKCGRFPRVSVRNGFTRPTGNINVNSPSIYSEALRQGKPQRKPFVACNFSCGDQPTRRLPPEVS